MPALIAGSGKSEYLLDPSSGIWDTAHVSSFPFVRVPVWEPLSRGRQQVLAPQSCVVWIHQMKKKKNQSVDWASSQLPACHLPLPQDQTEPLLSEIIPTAYSVTSGLLRDKDHVPKEAFHPSSNLDALKHPGFSLENCWLWGGLKWGPSTVTPGSQFCFYKQHLSGLLRHSWLFRNMLSFFLSTSQFIRFQSHASKWA